MANHTVSNSGRLVGPDVPRKQLDADASAEKVTGEGGEIPLGCAEEENSWRSN